MKTHILDCDGHPLCGCDSFTAVANSADCKRCNDRNDKFLAQLVDALDMLAEIHDSKPGVYHGPQTVRVIRIEAMRKVRKLLRAAGRKVSEG